MPFHAVALNERSSMPPVSVTWQARKLLLGGAAAVPWLLGLLPQPAATRAARASNAMTR